MKRVALAAFVLASPAHADTVADRALARHGAYDHAVRLADEVGARLAGSPAAEHAVTWAQAELKALGLDDVHTEPVTLQAWTRGAADRVELLGPYPRVLKSLALGRSPGTPAAGLTAEVAEVASLEELTALGDKVKGKVVFFDPAMKRTPGFEEYGKVGAARFRGAIAASKQGAVAALIRSIGTGSHRLPHTGATTYDPAVAQIPFAALAAEDALLLHRALERGPQKVKLTLGCGMRGAVKSANVVAQVKGRDMPDEVVLIGAHLDSWDVGDGALDDGAGVGLAMEVMRLVKEARPRRTVRIVLFMNEEYGLDGAKAYAKAHENEVGAHVAALEADAGGGPPLGVVVTGDEKARALVGKLALPAKKLLGAEVRSAEETGSDLIPLQALGVPTVGINQDASEYFEWHHTDGDTADKLDAQALAKSTAAFATLVLGLADSDATLPRVVTVRKPR